jgi:hypothetical protein
MTDILSRSMLSPIVDPGDGCEHGTTAARKDGEFRHDVNERINIVENTSQDTIGFVPDYQQRPENGSRQREGCGIPRLLRPRVSSHALA